MHKLILTFKKTYFILSSLFIQMWLYYWIRP